MSVNIKDNTSSITLMSIRNANLSLRFMLEDIEKISTPVTPKKEGNLRRDILKTVLGLKGTIKWLKDYAVFQEVKQFKNYTTPGTGPHYAENSVVKVASKSDVYFKKAGLI